MANGETSFGYSLATREVAWPLETSIPPMLPD